MVKKTCQHPEGNMIGQPAARPAAILVDLILARHHEILPQPNYRPYGTLHRQDQYLA
jgi:hypothetical protein